jgi:uncharacterized RDD family membrane protein YckC
MSSAQLDIQPLDEAAAEPEAAAPFALKQQVAERLAAHRARHSNNAPQPAATATPAAQSSSAKPRAARIAATVAERYAHSQSYRAFLAAEAERAIRQAEAAAEVAARSAKAIADAQNELLAEREHWTLTPPTPIVAPTPEPARGFDTHASDTITERDVAASMQVSSAGLTVRLYEDISNPVHQPFNGQFQSRYQQNPFDEDERLALEDEIAFRQSPTFDDPIAQTEIPANLIEFPRQLVASRRARPRIAEGPLRGEEGHAPDATQLRIFEVEPAQISTDPVSDSIAPEWSSILLGALPAYAATQPSESSPAPFNSTIVPQSATLNLRLMAGLVDGCIILAALLGFTAVFAFTLDKLSGAPFIAPLNLQTTALGIGGILAILMLLYQVLFFTFSDATPGMRYARIALCTFKDENPTRAAMRRRIFAAVLSACPLGIGFLWAWLDDDRLGWHDRISRMYQRSY